MPTSTPWISAVSVVPNTMARATSLELAKQPVLARLIERNEPARAGAHAVAVAQKKEQQEQHDRKPDDRSQRAQEKRAAYSRPRAAGRLGRRQITHDWTWLGGDSGYALAAKRWRAR